MRRPREIPTPAVVNPAEPAAQFDVALKGVAMQDKGRLWRIAAANAPGGPRVVDIAESAVRERKSASGTVIPRQALTVGAA